MSNFQDRFSFSRILTLGGIAFLLLGLILSSSAQAELIYAVRVNALNAAGNYNYRENNDTYSNYNFSTNDDTNTVRWCTQANNKPYTLTNDTIPVMLCDLGTVRTINAISVSPYSATSNIVKAMTVEFYDSPAINATPVYTQTFTGIPQSYKSLPLTTPTNARFVKITMTENYGGDRFGVGNLMFDVVSEGTPTSGTVNVPTYQNWPVSNLFDGNITTQWVTNVADATNGYYNGTNPNPVFTFTYDKPQTLTGIGVNGYNVSGNSLKDFNLSFYDASGAQISVADPSQYRFTMTHTTNQTRDEFTFPTVENVSKVEMTLTSNYKGTGSGGDRVGLSEVAFAVPTNLDTPTTPVIYNSPMSSDSTIVRPTSAQFLTPASERASARALTYLFDGTGSAGGAEWYTIDTKVGSNVIPDYYTVGYTPVIEFTMSEQAAYDSFSVWGYGNKGNLMSDFTLELYDSAGNLVYADEYLIDSYIGKSEYATFSFGDKYAFKTAVLTALDNGYNFYPSFTGGDRVGFTEIAFYQVAQEPYYYANTSDISAVNWTIDGSVKRGVIFTEGDSTATFANPVIFNGNGTIEIGSGKNLTLSGVVSGYGAITKTGAGTLTMTKANSYGGGTTIFEGTVKLTEAGTLGSGDVSLNDNTTLEFAHNSDQTVSNAISGYGSVSKTGTGTLTLSGYNSYHGDTTVSGGTLLVPTGSSMSNTNVEVTTGGTFQTGVDISSDFVLNGGTFVVGETSATKEITIGALNLDGGTIHFDFNDSSDPYDVDWLKVSTAVFDSGYIDLSFHGSSADDWWNVINDSGEGFSLINGTIQDYGSFDSNSVLVTVNGTLSNRWTLTATNDNLLLWAVEGSDDPGPGPGPGPEPGNNWYNADSTDIGLPSWTIDGTNKEGAILNSGSNPSVTYSNPVEMTANGTIQVGANYNLTLAGGLSGSGALEKTDAGKLTITTANSDFTGVTTVSGGTLELTGAGTLASSTINVGEGATMLYNNTVPHNTSPLTFNVNGGTLEFYNTTPATTHNIDNGISSGVAGQDVVINGTGATILIDGGGTISAVAGTGASGVTFALDSNSVIDVKSGMFINGSYQSQNWDNNQATLHIGATGKVDLWDGAQMKVGGLTGEAGAKIVNDSGKTNCKGIVIGNGVTADKTFVYNGAITLNEKAVDYIGAGTQVLNGNLSKVTIQSKSGTLVFGVPGETMSIKPLSKISTNGGAIRIDGNVVLDDRSSYVLCTGDWTGNGKLTIDGGYMRVGDSFNFSNGITFNGGMIVNNDNNATLAADITVTKDGGDIHGGWSKSITLTGKLKGDKSLTVGSDSGHLRFAGDASEYTGSLLVKGNMRIGVAGTTSVSATPYIGSQPIQLNGGMIQNSDNFITVSNDLNVLSESSLKSGWSKDTTYTGALTGPGKLKVISDSGWVIMGTSCDGTFTGDVQMNWDSATSMGKIRLAAPQPFGANAGSGYIYGQLDMNGYSQIFKGLYSNTSGTTLKGQIFNNTNTLSTLTLDITGKDLTFQGKTTGNVEMIINSNGEGKQTFANNGSNFTGNVVINGGTVTATAAHSSYTTTALGAFSKDGGRTVTINSGAELVLGTNDVLGGCNISYFNDNSLRYIINGGKLTGTNNNPLYNATFQNGAEVYGNNNRDIYRSFWLMGTNNVTFAGDGSTPESPVNFNGADGVIFVLDSAVLNVDDITKSSAADLVVNVKLGDKSEAFVANNSLTKTGAGTVRLTKVNEFTGPTTISAGALALASTGSLATDVTVSAGASFIDAAPSIASNVTLNGGSLVIGETTDSTQIAIGNLTVDNGAIYFDFNDSSNNTDYDRLTVNAATFTTGSINIAFNNGDQTEWWNNNTDNGYVLVDTTSLNVNLDNIQLLVNSAATDAWYLDTVGTSIVLKNQNVEPPVTDLYYRANSAEDIAAEEWAIDGVNKKGVTFTEGENNTATYTGEVEMNASGTFDVSENRNLALTGVVSGEGDVTKQGVGTLTLSGNNTYTGKTTVEAGTLALTGDAVKANSAIEIADDATLEYNVAANNTKQLTFSDNVTVSGGNVVKTGAGKLKIKADGDQFSSDKFTVSAGELDFKGEYNGDLFVQSGATLSPGNSVGDLTVYGDVTIDARATGLFEFSAYNEDPALQSYDRLVIGNDGSFVIDENSIIKLYFENGDANLWAAEGEEYKLVSDEGFVDEITDMSNLLGNFTNLFGLQGRTDGLYLIGLGAGPAPEPGSGVPEPSTWALLALGVIVLYLRRRVRS